jgi:hypothetical protein
MPMSTTNADVMTIGVRRVSEMRLNTAHTPRILMYRHSTAGRWRSTPPGSGTGTGLLSESVGKARMVPDAHTLDLTRIVSRSGYTDWRGMS